MVKGAYKQGGTYPTSKSDATTQEQTLGSGSLIPLLSENIVFEPNIKVKNTYHGKEAVLKTNPVNGNITVSGYYAGLKDLLYTCLGDMTTTTVVDIEEKTIKMGTDNPTGTLCFDKNSTIYTYRGLQIPSFNLSFTIKDGIRIDFVTGAFDFIRDSSKNTSSTTWDIGASYSLNMISPYECTIKIDSSPLIVNSFNLNVNNGQINSKFNYHSGEQFAPFLYKPVDNRDITGDISLPRFYSTDLYGDAEDLTTHSITLEAIDGNERFKIYIPDVIIKSVDDDIVDGRQKTKQGFTFECLNNSSFYIQIDNEI